MFNILVSKIMLFSIQILQFYRRAGNVMILTNISSGHDFEAIWQKTK